MKIKIKKFEVADMMLVSAAAGTCPECAVTHEAELPHNKDSLFYRYKFYQEHGRWPTFEDASAHCTAEMIEAWTTLEGLLRTKEGFYGDG